MPDTKIVSNGSSKCIMNEIIFKYIWRLGCMAIIVLALFYLQIMHTWSILVKASMALVNNFGQFQTNLATPGSGLDILPSQVQEMRDILQDNPQIVRYQLSQQLKADEFILQRSVETIWPKTLDSAAKGVFILCSELEQYDQCVEVDRGKEIALVECP